MIKGLYIHIPFCDSICTYCDFCKMVADKELKIKYIYALIKELEHHKLRYADLETIYIGGGTPSSLDLDLLAVLLQNIQKYVNVKTLKEYTIEVNPNDINQDFINVIKKGKINRVSMGVQTTVDGLLKFLKRTHRKSDVLNDIELLRQNDINNINLDFIHSIPNQTLSDIKADVDFIKTIKPMHISYYSLIIEENTLLSYMISQNQVKPLSADLEADYSEYIRDSLLELGYHRYEISNYAKNGLESVHNLLYWNLEEYIGIGLNAASQYDNKRFKNTVLVSSYIKNINNLDFTKAEEEFSPIMEYILMGLRKTKGISLDDFLSRYNEDIFVIYPGLKKHLNNGLLILDNSYLRFSKKGMELSNQVYLEIV
ncbi:radical SAM family heme chaperone HemW [Mycoplasmatota bacterium WC30]